MSKLVRILFVFLLISSSAFSQTQSDKLQSMRLDAEYYFFNGDYQRALFLYKDILKEDPDNCNVNYKAPTVSGSRPTIEAADTGC